MKNLSFLGILSRISFVAALVIFVHTFGWILPPLFIADRTLLSVPFEELINRYPQELFAPLMRFALFTSITLIFSLSELLVRKLVLRKKRHAVVANNNDLMELVIVYRWDID